MIHFFVLLSIDKGRRTSRLFFFSSLEECVFVRLSCEKTKKYLATPQNAKRFTEAWFFVRSKIPSEGSTGGYIEDKELTHTREEESEKKGTHKRSCCTVKFFFSV